MQDLEDIIKEENDTLKEEYKKLSKIKDPTAKIWKIRTGVLETATCEFADKS